MSFLLGLTFGGLVAVAVTAVLAFAVAANFRNTISLLDDKAVQTVHAVQLGLRMHLDPSRQAVSRLATLYRDGEFEISDDAEAQAALMGMLISRPNVDAVLIYDHNLVRRGVYSASDSLIRELHPSVVDNQVVYDQLKSIKPDAGARWSRLLYIPSSHAVYINAVAPLVRDGHIDGYVIAAISTGQLSNILREVVPTDGVAFVLDGGGDLIAHSEAERLGLDGKRTPSAPTVDPAKVDDWILNHRAAWEPVPLARYPATSRAGISISQIDADDEAFRFGGPPSIIITATLTEFGPSPWVIGIYFSGSDIGMELVRVWVSLAIGVIAMAAAVLIAFWLARRIARPLARVSKQASRIATLDIEDVDDLPASRVHEINTTATAFNSMLAGLRAFTLYVPRTLVAKLVESGMDETARSREAELTIMFSDIVGFTTLSESLSAQETAKLLNHHFEILVACVEAEGGTVDKFLGDGMLAFWGAPERYDKHADAAVRAAVAISRAIAADNAKADERGWPQIRLRIGIHTGPVIVGNIGTHDRVNYTIVGDNVNVCQRIEATGKEVAPGDDICVLMSAETVAALASDPPRTKVGTFHLRGRAAEVELWRLDVDAAIGASDPAPLGTGVTSVAARA